jgi:dTMP kinase
MAKIGKLIVIEGNDSSGKETQTKLLVKRLNSENISCATMSFPRYNTPTGRIIGQCYLGKKDLGKKFGWQGDYCWLGDANSVDPLVASLYYTADRVAAIREIKETLCSGTNLVIDRYVESNMAHQGGKEPDSQKRCKIFHKIDDLEYHLLGFPRPDTIVYLYMPYTISKILKLKRGSTDGHESNPKHGINAEKAYMQLAEMFKWIKIDCAPDKSRARSEEDIAEEVYTRVKPVLIGENGNR